MKSYLKAFFWYAGFFLIPFDMAVGQERHPFCGTDYKTEELIKSDSNKYSKYQMDLEELRQWAQNPEAHKLYKKKAVVTIPVVFHIIHNYGPENISKAQILEQMDILNKDFRRQNADASNTRAIFQNRAVDCEVEFKLATKAPDGSCTDGITRTQSNLTYGGDEDVKDLIRWPYRTYLNIWVLDHIDLQIDGSSLAGYTYRPPQSDSTIDGIIMNNTYIGASGTSNTTNAGRTLTHEVGHWLGLLHPFTNGCGGNCQTSGDFICDTPPVSTSNSGCPSSVNSCSNDSPDEPDNHENYMDYTFGSCQNMFTAGQKNLMQFYLSRNEYRGQNISTTAHNRSGINISNPCAPKADFQIASKNTTICPGSSVDFLDRSWNGEVIDRVWTFEGGSPSSSTFENPSVTYNQPGTYKVSLKVSNNEGESTMVREEFITVVKENADLRSPFTETFDGEFAPLLWEAETNQFSYGWLIKDGPSTSGSKSAECRIDQNTAMNEKFNLITPNFDLTLHKDLSPILSFRVAYSLRNSGAGERLLLYGSNDCGENWLALKALIGATTLKSVDGNNPGWKPSSPADWQVIEVNLDQHGFSSSSNLMIRFEATSNSGNSIFIDDVNVDQFALGLKPMKKETSFKILPNPSSGQFSIHSDYVNGPIHIDVMNINGQIIRKLDTNGIVDFEFELNKSGVYYVRIQGDGFTQTKRVIITK